MIGFPFALIGKGIAAVLSLALTVDEAITKVKPYLRKLPRSPKGQPIPARDVWRINEIARRAGHENDRTSQK